MAVHEIDGGIVVHGWSPPVADAVVLLGDLAEGQPVLHAKTARQVGEGKGYLAIRPEKVSISVEKPGDTPNALQGTILDIAYLGNLSTYHVKLANGLVMKAQAANTRRLSRREFTWEDKVWLSWTDTAAVVLER